MAGAASSPWGWPVAAVRCENASTAPRRQPSEFLDSLPCEELAIILPLGFFVGTRTMNSFSREEFDCHILEGFTAKDILDQKINEVSSSDDKDAFYVAELGDILKKHLRWLKALPRVMPFYVVKSNDSRIHSEHPSRHWDRF
ncbi:ornithine decarboxylase [Sigmodon hispidus]